MVKIPTQPFVHVTALVYKKNTAATVLKQCTVSVYLTFVKLLYCICEIM